MSTMAEVAKHAQVSIATVSNVIRGTRKVSEKRAERVQAAMRELNYHPNQIARSLKVSRTHLLAMVLPDITNPFFPDIIRGAEDAAFERGYFLVTANTDEQLSRERRILAAMRSYRMDGLLLASTGGTVYQDFEHIESLVQSGVPIVCIDRTVPGIKSDAVLVDNEGGARACVRHLIERGHARIAIITGPLDVQTGQERLDGYKNAMAESGCATPPDLIVQADFRMEGGRRAALQLLHGPAHPTAIFVCNGLMALGVLRVFEELGIRCPEDIALASFDDISAEHGSSGQITAVAQPSYQIGYKAASILIDRVESKLRTRACVLRISPRLIVRESTARTIRAVRQQRRAVRK